MAAQSSQVARADIAEITNEETSKLLVAFRDRGRCTGLMKTVWTVHGALGAG